MVHDVSIWNDLQDLLGPGSVLTSQEEIEQHSYDVWPAATKWKMQGKRLHAPEVVVRPTYASQVGRLLSWASERHIPVTPWGLGSSVTGAPLAMKGGISLDLSSMKRIEILDEVNLVVKVQAGMLGIELEKALNARGYTLNHSPQSLDRSSVGGWVSTRAMGQFSSRYGGIEDLTVAFTAILPTGETVETSLAPRAAVGPDLRHIFMGAEGTMGVITDVTLKIFPLPERRIFEAVRFSRLEDGLAAMRQIMRVGLRPFLVRYYDPDEARHAMKDNGFESFVMFLGFDGISSVAQAEYAAGMDICKSQGGDPIGPQAVEAWMERRLDFSTVENLLAQPGGLAETIEVAHFWEQIQETYTLLKESLAPFADEVLGHFSHVYPQGTSLYIILLGQARDDAQAEQIILDIWERSMRICLELGAAISHHHGVGLARLPYYQEATARSAPLLARMKAAMDPAGIMNPGKLGLA